MPNMTQTIYNLQEGINYSTVLAILKYSLRRFWNFFPEIKDLVFIDKPIIEDSQKMLSIFQISEEKLFYFYKNVEERFKKIDFPYHVITINDERYSNYLKASLNPPPVLFTRGNNDLMQCPSVSVVGTRHPSSDGVKRARKLALLLGDMGFVVASGLAKGIDTAAHSGTINSDGRTMAVIGTSLDECYPKENANLQEEIANKHLLISQFPFGHPITKYNFPSRNQTMSGLSLATIIVEAGETSGALIQAQQCLRQKRQLFILKNLVENPKLEWPKKYVGKEGVFIVSKIDDLIRELQKFKLVEEPKPAQHDENYDFFQ